MPVIFRVEDQNGKGPYQSHFKLDCLWCERTAHPTMYDDGQPNFRFHDHKDYFSGFWSLAQLDAWFFRRAVKRLLRRHGFVVKAYWVEHNKVVYGVKQVAFRRMDALPLYTKELR